MRATGRLCALLCALLALLPASAARAKITPLPKPAGLAAKPGTVHGTSLIAPVSRPPTRTMVTPEHRPIAKILEPTVHTTTTAHRGFAPATSRGGRDQSWRVLSSGGRVMPAVAGRAPTPLGLVRAGEAPPAHGYPWPVWKVALLTLLAVVEGFVLVHLARNGRFARAGETI
jgi:hypothetical protein